MAVAFGAIGLAAAPAEAQQNVYVAAGIPVDITGDLATLREKAMLQAQREGLQKVLSTIASAEDLKSITLPGDDEITSWVQDFEIEEEKTSASRYIGRFTFRFMADPIRQFLSQQGIAYAETESKAVLVLPVYTTETGDTELWGPTNPWFAAWASRQQQPGLVPIKTPVGDLPDTNAISATQALAGDKVRIQALADRYAVGDVMVAEAALQPPSPDGKRVLALTVASYGADNVQNLKDQVVSDTGDVDQLLHDGVERIAELVQNSWKLENLVDPNSRATVQVHVPFTSLSQWVAVKRHLAQVNLIKSVNLTRLARNGADIELTYLGDEVQFIRALNQADLMITSSGEGLQTMTLAPGGGTMGGGMQTSPDLTQPAAPQ
ncbi:DUF2066 domain-containing protein [Dongia sedimenti]|uniref:DUF2066 domain-containing protein n=1 Tax=Dongia sedimenti TaxID=3064282 RepID=A0ABU0YID1_9PROT|nr:DUF2066 domain-containing protein [Rhodospirillaceae bacterium R-7]